MKLKDLYKELIAFHKVNEADIRDLLIFHQKYLNSHDFFLHLEDDVTNEVAIRNDFKKLLDNCPIAYITNEYPFLGDIFYVNPSVLIPRPETEELVLLLLRHLTELNIINRPLKILEVGTGSGVIAIELAKKLPLANIIATDISSKALEVANINSRHHNVHVDLVLADTYPNQCDIYDVIISNPPYIKDKSTIDVSVINYEPIGALLISDDNNVYEKIFKDLRINPQGIIVFEIAPDLVEDLKVLMNKYLKDVTYIFSKDINNKIRFLTIIFH